MGSGQWDTGPRLGRDYAGYTSMGPDTAIDPGKQVSGGWGRNSMKASSLTVNTYDASWFSFLFPFFSFCSQTLQTLVSHKSFVILHGNRGGETPYFHLSKVWFSYLFTSVPLGKLNPEQY